MNYTHDLESAMKNAYTDRIFITHPQCDSEIVNEVKNYIKSLGMFDEVLETRVDGVVSSHCGPGTLGVLFIQNK